MRFANRTMLPIIAVTSSRGTALHNHLMARRSLSSILPDLQRSTREVISQPDLSHDFSRVPARAADTCPITPQRCPFGGACHSCPLRIQAKLTVSQPGDKYEEEADRVADQVMSMPEPQVQRVCPHCDEEERAQAKPLADQITPLVQRQVAPEKEDEEDSVQTKAHVQRQVEDDKAEEEPVQTKPLVHRQVEDDKAEEEPVQIKAAARQPTIVSPGLAAQIQSLRGGGQPLPPATRAFFEPRFGRDFSGVRVHTDAGAAETARALSARAFTVGQDLVFGAGEYAIGAGEGRQLIAHELAHVVLQSTPQKLSRRVIIETLPIPTTLTSRECRAFIKSHEWGSLTNRTRANSILQDMAQAGDPFLFKDRNELKTEIVKRMAASRYMQESQRNLGGNRKAFGYPSLYYGPRVNYDARDYWTPKVIDNYARRKDMSMRSKDPNGDYSWHLTKIGKNDPYSAIGKLFTPQPPHKRTLIHCDYLVSLVHYRSFADGVGKEEFNRKLKTFGINNIELKWNAFADLELYTVVNGQKGKRLGIGSLQWVRPSSPKDLVIGDHVIFKNHPAYALINQQVKNPWKLENAILIERSGNKDIFLGHGSKKRTEKGMRIKLAKEYNRVVKMAWKAIEKARAKNPKMSLTAIEDLKVKFSVDHSSGQWEIQGLSKPFPLRIITAKEVPGFWSDSQHSRMSDVLRPIESD